MYGFLLAAMIAGQQPVASIETVIMVKIDEDAVLLIQDRDDTAKWHRSKNKGTERKLITPPCDTSKEWSYVLRAVKPSGTTITRTIKFRPGRGVVKVNMTN